jgi:hypothetical protein
MREGYDTAQICMNGHVANSSAATMPHHNQRHCEKCGAPTITSCEACGKPIRGYYWSPGYIGVGGYDRPGFCHECGKPFPWTAKALAAAEELVGESESLSPEDKEQFSKNLPDVVRDTPSTSVAASRIKKLLGKMGAEGGSLVRDVLKDVVTAAVKASLGIPG